MPGPHPPGLVEAAALAVATGQAIPKWAEANGVSARSVQRWATKPAFRRRVAEIHQRTTDRTIAILTTAATSAAIQLTKLATQSADERVRLQASRAILGGMLSVSNHAEIKAEIEALKAGVAAQEKRRAGSERKS